MHRKEGSYLEKLNVRLSQVCDYFVGTYNTNILQFLFSHNGGKNFHFSVPSRPTLGPTQPPIQWVSEAFSPGGKAAGA
jgi:hypothetical protein